MGSSGNFGASDRWPSVIADGSDLGATDFGGSDMSSLSSVVIAVVL